MYLVQQYHYARTIVIHCQSAHANVVRAFTYLYLAYLDQLDNKAFLKVSKNTLYLSGFKQRLIIHIIYSCFVPD